MSLDRLVVRSQLEEAWGYLQEGRYEEQLHVAREALGLARALDDLGLQIQATDAEATALRMLGRVGEALERASWIVERAEQVREDDDATWHVAGAWLEWVHGARMTAGMDTERLLSVIDEGEAWLRAVGREGWRAGLCHERARLLQARGHPAEALPHAEEAVALEQANPDAPGYTLASYRWSYGDILRELGRNAEAVEQYEAVLDTRGVSAQDRKAAHQGLAWAALADPLIGSTIFARPHAERAVQLAELMGDAALLPALQVQVAAARAADDLPAARASADRALQRARATRQDRPLYAALMDAIDLAIQSEDGEHARGLLDEATPIGARIDADRGTDRCALAIAERRRAL